MKADYEIYLYLTIYTSLLIIFIYFARKSGNIPTGVVLIILIENAADSNLMIIPY